MYRIKVLREAKGWTMAQLGERVGVTAQAIYHWEHGNRDPSVEMMRKLADVLETDMNFLFGTAPAETGGGPEGRTAV